MIPVQIRDNGRMIQFKSRSIFLRMIGKNGAYLHTNHFKETNEGITFQQLWDRNNTGHINLERHIAGQKPLVTDEGVMAYDGDHILVKPIDLIPNDSQSAITEPTAPTNHTPVATPVTLNDVLATRIREEIDILVQRCEENEGKEAAELLRASITDITIGVKSVSGNTDHWLCEYFEECLFQN